MTIGIDNLAVANTAPSGTAIGVLTTKDPSGAVIPCNYTLTKGSAGFFAILEDRLIVAWQKVPAVPGYYSVRVRAVGASIRFSDSARFTVSVEVSPSPPPPPAPAPPPPSGPSIAVNGSSSAVVSEGASIAIAVAGGSASMTDWVGLAGADAPDTTVIAWAYLNGLLTPPDVGIASATVMMMAPTADGSYEARFYADNSWMVLARSKFTVQGTNPPPPPPPSVPPPPPPPPSVQPVITVTPDIPLVADTTPRGTVIASYSVVMSDGTPFTGTVRFGAPYYDAGGIFALSDNKVIINPTGPGIGPNMTTVTDHITLEAIP
jgi:hypothetical protein